MTAAMMNVRKAVEKASHAAVADDTAQLHHAVGHDPHHLREAVSQMTEASALSFEHIDAVLRRCLADDFLQAI